MTKQEYDALPDREKDALVATEVMEESKPSMPVKVVGQISMTTLFEAYPYKAWGPEYINEGWQWVPLSFHTSITAAWTVEEAVGAWPVALRDLYSDQLIEITTVVGSYCEHPDDLWALLHATPAQRCEAALHAKGVIELQPSDAKPQQRGVQYKQSKDRNHGR